jgi:hypothetical protein
MDNLFAMRIADAGTVFPDARTLTIACTVTILKK